MSPEVPVLSGLSIADAGSGAGTRASSLNAPLTLGQKFKAYFSLGKPGIAASVLITTFAGYMAGLPFRPQASFSLATLLHALFGTFCVSMGAGALNMLLESDGDALMDRTKRRPIPSETIPAHHAFFLGGAAASFGIAHLAGTINLRAAFAAAISLVLYLVFYTPLKRSSRAATVVGAAAGALPPLIGWSASGADFGWNTWSLFAIVFLWQFPHFLALFWLYRADFAKAGIKTLLPSDESGEATARAALKLTCLLAVVSIAPYFLGVGRTGYLAAAIIMNAYLIYNAVRFTRSAGQNGALRYFLSTVIYLPALFLSLIFRF